MKCGSLLLLLALVACVASSQARPALGDFVGMWFSVDFDNNVDSGRYLIIKKSTDNLAVQYKEASEAFGGILSYSLEQRGFVGVFKGLGTVVIRKIKSTAGLSLDQITEFEDIPLGFFQKRDVLENTLGLKLPNPDAK